MLPANVTEGHSGFLRSSERLQIYILLHKGGVTCNNFWERGVRGGVHWHDDLMHSIFFKQVLTSIRHFFLPEIEDKCKVTVKKLLMLQHFQTACQLQIYVRHWNHHQQLSCGLSLMLVCWALKYQSAFQNAIKKSKEASEFLDASIFRCQCLPLI